MKSFCWHETELFNSTLRTLFSMMPHIGSFNLRKFKCKKTSVWDNHEINSVGTDEKNCLNFLQTEKRPLSPTASHNLLFPCKNKSSKMGYFCYIKISVWFLVLVEFLRRSREKYCMQNILLNPC